MKIYRKGAHRNNDTQKGKIFGRGIALPVFFTVLVVGLVFFYLLQQRVQWTRSPAG